MERIDVLVVGLGPAGAAAATAAARAGARVLAIEARDSGRAMRPEVIPHPFGPQADRLASHAATRPPETAGSGGAGRLWATIFDRGAFETALVDFARSAGARLAYGTSLSALDADSSTAELLQGDEGRRHLNYGALVAADGPDSTVARLLGYPALRKMYALNYRVALHVPQQRIGLWQSPRFPGGYGWLIPAGEEAIVGTCWQTHCHRQALEALHDHLAATGRVGRHVLGEAAGVVPVDGLRRPLAYGNILFAGDAAGMCHPLIGLGVVPAVTAGEAAGKAAAHWCRGDTDAVPAYTAAMVEGFGPALARAKQMRQALLAPLPGEDDALAAGSWRLVGKIDAGPAASEKS